MGSRPTVSCPILHILPEDLHFHLFSVLSFPEARRLRATNHYFYELHTPTQLSLLRSSYVSVLLNQEHKQRQQLNALLTPSDGPGIKWDHASQSIRQEHFPKIPCYTCLEWQPLHMFTNSMKGGIWCREKDVGQARASERICVPCGVRTGFYQAGGRCGDRFSICLECRKLVDWQGRGKWPQPQTWCDGCRQDIKIRGTLKQKREERTRLKTNEIGTQRRRKKEESARFMQEGRVDWGFWKRTGRGLKRRRKTGIAEEQKYNKINGN